MKYQIAGFEDTHGKRGAGEQTCDPLGGILVLRKKQHGGFGKDASVPGDLGDECIACTALQAVYHKGQGPFGTQLLSKREKDAFIFTVAPYELCNAHGSVRKTAHGRIDLALYAELCGGGHIRQ